VAVLGPAQQLTAADRVGGDDGGGSMRSWRVDVGAAFQLTHNLGSHVETGGADIGWARRSLLLKA
jgi:hypothetical protein